jgi:4-amino-4-deoxychorismate lyase
VSARSGRKPAAGTQFPPVILVNGTDRGGIPALDRGLAYGDGVFRTLLARDGVLLHWKRHYAKLAHDCGALGMACPEEAVLRCDALAVLGAGGECAVKIVVTRGVGERGYRFAASSQPTRIVYAAAVQNERHGYARDGIRVRACRLALARQPVLAGVKHLNRLENVLARAEWSDPGIVEGLMNDDLGNVIGGTMTNLFLVRDGKLLTPALTQCGVAGVTRERVIALAARHGLECEVRSLRWEEVASADEVFVVNSLAGLWPVRALEARRWAPGPIGAAVQRWLAVEDDAQAL